MRIILNILATFTMVSALILSASTTIDGTEIKIAAKEDVISSIITVQSLEPLKKKFDELVMGQPEKVLVLFDLDDTVFDFPYMLGSKAWRNYIKKATKEIDSSKNWHDILSLRLAQQYSLKTVEPDTAKFINDLQAKGYIVCGLTSRERNKWYDTAQEGVDQLTTEQLESVSIDFSNESLQSIYPYLAADPEYFKGTFFADTDLKGDYLLKLFAHSPAHSDLPSIVFFIDDKLNQVESVAHVLTDKLEIENVCVVYTATEGKAKTFNPLIANIQLFEFISSNYESVLSDEQAAEVAKANPERNADYYLTYTLDLIRYIK